jgi:hypothetical protein
MASLGPGNYIVFVQPVGGSKDSAIKLVLQIDLTPYKTWFLAGSILPYRSRTYNCAYEAPIGVAVHELFEETCLTITVDDLSLLSDTTMYAYRYPLAIISSFTSLRHRHMFRT